VKFLRDHPWKGALNTDRLWKFAAVIHYFTKSWECWRIWTYITAEPTLLNGSWYYWWPLQTFCDHFRCWSIFISQYYSIYEVQT